MQQQTKEIELSTKDAQIVLGLIDRVNRLTDEISELQVLAAAGQGDMPDAHWYALHDELDAATDYRECIVGRIARLTLSEAELEQITPNHPDYQPAGLGSLGEDD